MSTHTMARRQIQQRIATVAQKLRQCANALSELGEQGMRAILLEAIEKAEYAEQQMKLRIAETRSPRGPKEKPRA